MNLDQLTLAAFEQAGDALVAIDREGVIRAWNPSVCARPTTRASSPR